MERGTFIAARAGPARLPVLGALAVPLNATTIVIEDGMSEGWLRKLLASRKRRPLQLLWPDRSPAGLLFGELRDGGAALASKNEPARVRSAGRKAVGLQPTREPPKP
jgi:hypothetical protein